MSNDENVVELSPAQRRQRQEASSTHGARSPAQIKARARAHRRRLLRQIGTPAGELDAVAIGYLDLWARSMAKVSLYDDYADEHGWLDEDGNERGFVRTYFAALNSCRLALAKLEDHLRSRGAEPSMVVALQGAARRVEP